VEIAKLSTHSGVAEDSSLKECDTLNSRASRPRRIISSNGVKSYVCN
jgi:hypothetical protein